MYGVCHVANILCMIGSRLSQTLNIIFLVAVHDLCVQLFLLSSIKLFKPVKIDGFKKNLKRTYIHIDQHTDVIKSCVLLTSSFYFQFNFGGKYYGNI